MKQTWNTMETKGPLFTAEYAYKSFELSGEPLSPLAEEMLYAYAGHNNGKGELSDYAKKPIFNKNFYSCLKKELTENQKKVKFPEDYNSILFKMFTEKELEKENKKNKSKEEKNKEKADREILKNIYGYAVVDGKKQQIGSYVMEPAGIFIARGDSKNLGLWKYRPTPETININCSSNPPLPPEGHTWKKVECNHNLLAPFSFIIDVGHKLTVQKAARFTYGSELGNNADEHKFEVSLALWKNWDMVQKYILDNVNSSNKNIRQCALIAWLIQNTSIRIGGASSDERENNVVGASTLKKENIHVDVYTDLSIYNPKSKDCFQKGEIKLNFLGKDSVPYNNVFETYESNVVYALDSLIRSKNEGERIFDVSAGEVNKFLQKCIPEITVKMFRPALGNHTLVEKLNETDTKTNDKELKKVMDFTRANLATAKLLNHQKNVAKSFQETTKKLAEKTQDQKIKTKELKRKVAEKLLKYKKDIDMLEQVYKGKELAEKKRRIKDKIKVLKERVEKAEARVETSEGKLALKKETKQTALATSLGSYIDPRAVSSWCKEVDLDVKKLYTKSLYQRFENWAFDDSELDSDFWKKYA
jgi:DNA topoisomerase-1